MKGLVEKFKLFFYERNTLKRNEEIFIPAWWENSSLILMLIIPVIAFSISLMAGIHSGDFLRMIADSKYVKSWIGVFALSWGISFSIFYVMDAGHVIIKNGVFIKRFRFVFTEECMLSEIASVSMGHGFVKNEGWLHLDIRNKFGKIIYINASAYSNKTIECICHKIGIQKI